MAWRVGLVCGDALDRASLGIAVGYMPVWASRTPTNLALAPVLRQRAQGFWDPEPTFTVFGSQKERCSDQDCLLMLSTIQEHHPSLSKIEIFGVPFSDSMDTLMVGQGFLLSSRPWPEAIGYRRPLAAMPSDYPHIELDGRHWSSSEEVYGALLMGIRAPTWHGHNFNALNDSIMTGSINGIEPPFAIKIAHSRCANDEARLQLQAIYELFRQFEEEGCPVSMALL